VLNSADAAGVGSKGRGKVRDKSMGDVKGKGLEGPLLRSGCVVRSTKTFSSIGLKGFPGEVSTVNEVKGRG
jgi:hypothetical protein